MKYYFEVANMAASKLEINFRRLLERCEAMAAEFQDNKENVSWRLEKVGGIFDQWVIELFYPFFCLRLRSNIVN